MIDYVDTKKAAEELGVNASRVRQLLAESRIAGAQKVGRDWIIPSPVEVIGLRDKRRKSLGSA